MRNPRPLPNPFLSAWLTAANQTTRAWQRIAEAMVRRQVSHAIAEGSRGAQQVATSLIRETTKHNVELMTQWVALSQSSARDWWTAWFDACQPSLSRPSDGPKQARSRQRSRRHRA